MWLVVKGEHCQDSSSFRPCAQLMEAFFRGWSAVLDTKYASASAKLSGDFVPKGRVMPNSRVFSSSGRAGSEER